MKVGVLTTAYSNRQLALPILIGANFGHNPYIILVEWNYW